MKLMTKSILKDLPPLYGTEEIPLKDKIARIKFFDPCGAYTAYIVEGSQEEGDFIMWGWATFGDPDCAEFGYVSLNEISSVRNRFGLGIERDLYWKPTRLGDIPEIKIYTTK
jgi:hypothetical protein